MPGTIRCAAFREAAYEAKQTVDDDAKAWRRAPIEHDPEV